MSIICLILFSVQWLFSKRGYETFSEFILGQNTSETTLSIFAFALFVGFAILTTVTSHLFSLTRENHRKYALTSDRIEDIESFKKKQKTSFILFVLLFAVVMVISYLVITVRSDFSGYVKAIELDEEGVSLNGIESLLDRMKDSIVYLFFIFVIFEILVGLYFLKFLELAFVGARDFFTRLDLSSHYRKLTEQDSIVYQMYIQEVGDIAPGTKDILLANLTTTSIASLKRSMFKDVGNPEDYLSRAFSTEENTTESTFSENGSHSEKEKATV